MTNFDVKLLLLLNYYFGSVLYCRWDRGCMPHFSFPELKKNVTPWTGVNCRTTRGNLAPHIKITAEFFFYWFWIFLNIQEHVGCVIENIVAIQYFYVINYIRLFNIGSISGPLVKYFLKSTLFAEIVTIRFCIRL